MQQKPKITYLDPVPVRYSGSVPNLSRRGGIRIHPVRDGSLNPSRQTEQLRTRDMGGNKLVDVTDRQTGFVTGVRSSLESAPNWPAGQAKPTRPAVSGGKTGQLRNLPECVLVCADTGDVVYLDEDGRRIRTLDMGEASIPTVPRSAVPSTGAKPVKQERTVKPRAAKPASPDTRPAVPGTRSGTGRITDEDVRDYLRALYRRASKPVPSTFSRQHMHDARLALAAKIRQAQQALGGASGASGAAGTGK